MGAWQTPHGSDALPDAPLRAALRTSHSPDSEGPCSPAGHAAAAKAASRQTMYIRLVAVGVMVVLMVVTGLTLGRKDTLQHLMAWMDSHQVAGAAIFFAIYIWFTVLFLPAAVLSLAAGALFGMWLGLLFVWVAAVIGESLSFLLRRWVQELTENWASWHAMEAALAEDGWKLVALLRVSPVMPFSIINYALGTTSLPFQQYFWPSVFGIVPGIIIYVYLGSLARDLTEVVQEGGASKHGGEGARIGFMVFGAVSAVVVIVLSAVYTKRAITQRLAHVRLEGSDTPEELGLLDVEAGQQQRPQRGEGPRVDGQQQQQQRRRPQMGDSSELGGQEQQRRQGGERLQAGEQWQQQVQRVQQHLDGGNDDGTALVVVRQLSARSRREGSPQQQAPRLPKLQQGHS